MPDDHSLMLLALEQAQRARGRTSPNPMVGCVIARDGQVLATGFHQGAGLPHAEAEAVAKLQGSAVGATAYVTLEPCNHQGRTPPCTTVLLKAGLERVVIAMRDPNPAVTGGGVERLRAGGLQVDVGECAQEAARLNEAWLHRLETGRPFVIAKIAQSVDGAVATARGQSRWITGELARQQGHVLRDQCDAIMVGAGTVRADNPRLTTRVSGGRNPLRLVVCSGAELDPKSRVFSPRAPGGAVLAVTRKALRRQRGLFSARGVCVLPCRAQRGRVDLKHLLALLPARGVDSLLVEGGSTLLGALFGQRLVDKVYFFIAPLLLGANAMGAIGDWGPARLVNAPRLRDVAFRSVGEDLMLTAYLDYRRLPDRV